MDNMVSQKNILSQNLKEMHTKTFEVTDIISSVNELQEELD